jgi:hypothetical protein
MGFNSGLKGLNILVCIVIIMAYQGAGGVVKEVAPGKELQSLFCS